MGELLNKKNIVVTLDSLLESKDIIKTLLPFYNVKISGKTLDELGKISKSENKPVAKRAQSAINRIEKLHENIELIWTIIMPKDLLNAEIEAAKASDSLLYTRNKHQIILCRTIAPDVQILNIAAEYEPYKGYIEIEMSVEEYAFMLDNVDTFIEKLNLFINEYVIIKFKEDGKTLEYRYDGKGLVKLKLPNPSIIRPKNVLQKCALDMLNNEDIDICAILGLAGSGKSYLSMRMALYHINSGSENSPNSILAVREPVAEGEEVGFLKGDFEDKTRRYFLPFMQSLDGGEDEFERLSYSVDTTIPRFMKGTTYHNTFILVDEAEDLKESQIKLIGSRLGENSKIFFSGDYKQGINDSTLTNPLVKMCEEFKGNPKFACIYLDDDVRSEASKMFASLYQSF